MIQVRAGKALLLFVISASLAPALVGAADRPRVCIAGVRGDPAQRVSAQLERALCARFECVPRQRIMTDRRIDFRAVKRERVQGVLFGTVAGRGSRAALQLSLLTVSLQPEQGWTMPLDQAQRIGAAHLDAFVRELQARVRPVSPTPPSPGSDGTPLAAAPDVLPEAGRGPSPRLLPPQPVGPAPRASAAAAPPPAPGAPRGGPASTPASTSTSPSRAPMAVEPAPTTAPPRAPSPGPAPPASMRSPPPPDAAETPTAPPQWLALEIGLTRLQRSFQYQGIGPSTGVLMKESGGAMWAPSARIEVVPWAGSGSWTSGLTAFASYRRSVGFELERAGTTLSAVYSEGEVGVGQQVRPVGSSRFTVTPTLSYRLQSLTVSNRPVGFASPALAGPSLGLDLLVPFGRAVALVGRGSYTSWIAREQVVSSVFFPRGSASALDFALGLSAVVRGPLSVRVVGEYMTTTYSGLGGSAAYAATGATDRYVAVRALVRWAP